MKNYRPTILLFAFLVAVSQVQGRLGETPEQCDARYGQPTEAEKDDPAAVGARRREYEKKGVEITVSFYQGKAALLIFVKKDRSGFTPDEIQALLAANSGSSSWKPVKSPREGHDGKPAQEWERSDGIGGADLYYVDNPYFKCWFFSFRTKSYDQLPMPPSESEKPKSKTLDGF